MNIRHIFCVQGLILILLFIPKSTQSQNLYFNTQKELQFVDRLHTIYGHNGDTFLVNTPLSSMADAFNLYSVYKTDVYNGVLANKDIYLLNQLLIYNSDLSSNIVDPLILAPKYTGTLGFYRNTPFLLEKKGIFNLIIQPQFALTGLFNTNANADKFYTQKFLGIYTRMTIGERFGLQFSGILNSEDLLPNYSSAYFEYYNVPGYIDKEGYGFHNHLYHTSFLPKGQATFDIIPKHISLSAGFDQLFIGEGFRSLALGNSSSPMPYLALKTKFWKFDYTNIFLKPESQTIHTDNLPYAGQNKYVSIHYLSANIGKRFNIGFFETITSSREKGPELSYFNPVIFYRSIERHLGSPDKMALGLTGSAILYKGLKVYGQFFINEFIIKELVANEGYIHNKWGAQFGLKYYNVANIENLDIQLETNIVRPYAYQHRSNSNYSHNNLPLAHPLGANFKEYLFNVSYSPLTRLEIQGRVLHYQKGKDINDKNYGGNILKDIRYVPNRYGIRIVNGDKFSATSAELSAKYEILPYLFFELGGLYRQEQLNGIKQNKNIYVFSSLLFHLNRRDFLLF